MEDRILDTADRLFYREGIRAVGVDRIATDAGISKRTLYNHFPSKDDLIVAYLSRRLRPLTSSGAPPAEQILAVFERFERTFARRGFRGCPFVNAVAELGDSTPAVRAIAAAYKEQRRALFRELLTRLAVPDPDGLASQLTLLLEGAISTMLVRGDPTVARVAGDAARTLIGAAAGPVREDKSNDLDAR